MTTKVRKHMAKNEKNDGKAEVKAAAPKPQKLKVKAGMKYRGAREAWYQRLLEHDGKDVEIFLKSATDRPPSMTKANTAENPKGWLSFFRRTGVAVVGDEAAKA